jgi:hypothetical protein
MRYQKAKKYLVAFVLSVAFAVLSGSAGSSIVTAADSSYQSSYYQNHGGYGESQRIGLVDWHPRGWRYNYRGYYGPYGYRNRWGYYGPYGYYNRWGYYRPYGYYHRWGY